MSIEDPQSFNGIAGDTFRKRCTARDKVTLEPINLSGYTLKGAIWRRGGTQVIAQSPEDIELTVVDTANGVFNWIIPAATTQALDGTYEYQVQITSPGAEVDTPLHGQLTFDTDYVPPTLS